MNEPIFSAMQSQMTPSAQAVAELKERLARTEPVRRKSFTQWKAALAACAALAIVAYPAYRTFFASQEGAALHSYVLEEGHSPYQLSTAITDAQGEREELGAQYAERAPAVNTGQADEPAADLPVQEEALRAYENLMARFKADYGEETWPDWYGGCYIDASGVLVVNVAEAEPFEENFFLQLRAWADSEQISFAQVKYDQTFLRQLQKKVEALPELKELAFWGCGEDVTGNRVELTVPEANEALLKALAELDPEDDAILVRVEKEGYHFTDMDKPIQPGGVAPVDDIAPVENTAAPDVKNDAAPDAVHRLPGELPGGAIVTDGEIAYEPQLAVTEGEQAVQEAMGEGSRGVSDLPQSKQPGIDTKSYQPE